MYKTLNRLNVYIHGDENPYTFSDDATLSSGTTALSQVKNCRDIDTILDEGSVPAIIPYHAIDCAIVESMRQSVPDPEDDNLKNCTGGGEVETGTLTIINGRESTIEFAAVLISEALNGTYGDLTFSTDDGGNPFPDGYQAVAIVGNLAAGATLTAPGLPYGAHVSLHYGSDTPLVGSIPETLTVGGGGPGPT